MIDIYSLLEENGISYEKVEHPPVFTCEEAERLVPPIDGAHTKNLFLRDKKGKRYFLVVVGYEKAVDLKELSKQLDLKGLSFASEERLMEYLGVTPGSATILGLVHDKNHAVEVIFDEEIAQADALLCHPLVNTATLSISREGIEKFLQITGHTANSMNLPNRSENS